MFNGLSKEKADHYLKPFAPSLLDFVEAIYADKAGQDEGGWRRRRRGCLGLLHAACVAASACSFSPWFLQDAAGGQGAAELFWSQHAPACIGV